MHDHSTVHSLITRVADRQGVSPLDLDPLASAIDPAVVSRFASSDRVPADAELRFRYCGHEITLTGDGAITIEVHSA